MSYAVSLVGGPTSREGRLQVYYNDVWGTVCDDGFNDAAARVVCHSLGFGYAYVYIYINLAYFFTAFALLWFENCAIYRKSKTFAGSVVPTPRSVINKLAAD